MAHSRNRQRGFTLIDVLGAIVIVSTAIAATMEWMASGTMANGQTGQMSVAVVLANNVHDYALTLNPGKPDVVWSDRTQPAATTHVLDLDARTFSTPLTSHGDALASTTMPGWSLSTTVVSCHPSDLNPSVPLTFATTVATDIRRLTVVVNYRGKSVYSAVWLLSPSTSQH